MNGYWVLFSDPVNSKALLPEFTLLVGLILLLLVPNLGIGGWRVPFTTFKIPVGLTGRKLTWTSDPRVPGIISVLTLFFALILALFSQLADPLLGFHRVCIPDPNNCSSALLRPDGFSRLMEIIFFSSLLMVSLASLNRVPATPTAGIPTRKLPNDFLEARRIEHLTNNRRQSDLHILLLVVALGMALVSLALDLFVLFLGLELASMAIYVLVGFHKENLSGTEGGAKYFITGAVSSATALYGMSLLYIWNGSLHFSSLEAGWLAMNEPEVLPLLALGLILAGFGFKVTAVPFHFAAPDAYNAASSPIAGMLSTASKAMGFAALLRLFAGVALPIEGAATWAGLVGLMAFVTMTWGNIAALSSTNPRRMLAYSSVAHAGYLLAALAAIGAWRWSDSSFADAESAAYLLVAAMLFHLFVLVLMKLGAFLVISLYEIQGRGNNISDFRGLARREPLLAVVMMLFMLSLAGIPPLAGFMSKFLLISGMVEMGLPDGVFSSGFRDALGEIHWVFWLALGVLLNSAISLFYYLRIVVLMFFDNPDKKGPLPPAPFIRIAIIALAVGTVLFGLSTDLLFNFAHNAALTLFH